jgi:hypothetical protein
MRQPGGKSQTALTGKQQSVCPALVLRKEGIDYVVLT